MSPAARKVLSRYAAGVNAQVRLAQMTLRGSILRCFARLPLTALDKTPARALSEGLRLVVRALLTLDRILPDAATLVHPDFVPVLELVTGEPTTDKAMPFGQQQEGKIDDADSGSNGEAPVHASPERQ